MHHKHTHDAEAKELRREAKTRKINVSSVEFLEDHPEKGEVFLLKDMKGVEYLAWFCASGRAIITPKEI